MELDPDAMALYLAINGDGGAGKTRLALKRKLNWELSRLDRVAEMLQNAELIEPCNVAESASVGLQSGFRPSHRL